MALQTVTIGSMDTVHQYDDGATPVGITTSAGIRAGAIGVDPTDVLRLSDIPTLGTIVSSAAVILDHAIVRGDGGARGVQDSLAILNDLGALTGLTALTVTNIVTILGTEVLLADGVNIGSHDSDDTHNLSRATIGFLGNANWASFGHRALGVGGSDYALSQGNLGTTNLNCSTAKEINFKRNDATLATLTQLASLVDNSMVDTLHRHSELSASDGAPDQAVIVDDTGKVGIGTTVPTEKLDVNGNIKLPGSLISTYTTTNDYRYFIRTNVNSAGNYEYTTAQPVGLFISDNGRFSWSTAPAGTAGNPASWTERMAITSDGNVGIAESIPTISDGVGLHLDGKIIRIEDPKTPATAGAAGNIGEICWDTNYIYVCIAANSWKRSAIAAGW
uniref:Uncharacterized protein n=1 Tax=viral metagenome TaxID=1070528 RepID=A0A6M3ILX5_9ZZZZ